MIIDGRWGNVNVTINNVNETLRIVNKTFNNALNEFLRMLIYIIEHYHLIIHTF
jgi:hypothetical protein